MWNLTQKVFISVPFSIVTYNPKVNFAEKPQMKINSLKKNYEYISHTQSEKN